jgi:hypothetical protein
MHQATTTIGQSGVTTSEAGRSRNTSRRKTQGPATLTHNAISVLMLHQGDAFSSPIVQILDTSAEIRKDSMRL